ncbi:MAG: spore germination protein [Clostridia bacterium]|nr:spore germination protein [Clostridia bacterium]
MNRLSTDYRENVALLDRILRVEENFDIIKKPLTMGADELTFYYIDGFVKDGTMQKLMIYLLSVGKLDEGADAARVFLDAHVPYVETELTASVDLLVQMMLSGAVVMLGSRFGANAILIDARTYPARETSEPQNDRVMLGARDGFVETLIFNTALIRRRIRDASLTMKYIAVGEKSKTDVVLCYMKDRADRKLVDSLYKKLTSIKTDALPMGHQSLGECLIRSRWYNPFPKIRTTERPDAAAAQLLEGSVMILVDNSPEVMILPTSIFDFIQETNDYYFPPLTGTFLRLVRQVIMLLTLFMTPLWFLLVKNPDIVPQFLAFTIPESTGKIPILAQLLLTEFVIDGLRMASMNTPDMLSNSLSVVGGLILGDFAIGIGWLIPEVILYMAFVSIANFSQRNYELGYAFKFLRILLLIATALFNVWGFIVGVAAVILLIVSNKTVNGTRSYLYPVIPFSWPACKALFFRVKKRDVSEQ